MILTGKCKEAFGDQCEYDYSEFRELPELFQNALIIDFFDSVDIYVNAVRYNEKWKSIADYQLHETFISRQEAINKAIAKANEIFNNR